MAEKDPIFLLFAESDYYPNGGWLDYRGQFVSVTAARLWLYEMREESNGDWYHIVDLSAQTIVEAGELRLYGPVSEEEEQKLRCDGRDGCDWFLRPLRTTWSSRPDDRDDDTVWKCQACGRLYCVKRDIAAAEVTVEKLKEPQE